ncbi:MAG TPA: hypothetical protein VHE78_15095 [Gemmatimonadaceae bacterium]|nr:hypothetical protein [Gemmatimonadaceae bacterium]
MTSVSRKKTTPTRARQDTPPAGDPLNLAADAMLRSAVEACRHHERVASLQQKGCDEDELQHAAAVCELSHKQLAERTTAYEATAAAGRGATDDALWHAANVLWHASREYARRHRSCDTASSRMVNHSTEKLGELTMEYELAASALLALRHAIAGYRKLRPAAV